MAIATVAQRLSAFNVTLPGAHMLPLPDGAIAVEDWPVVAYLYVLPESSEGVLIHTKSLVGSFTNTSATSLSGRIEG